MKRKSKIIKEIKVKEEFFMDFFRGCIDGDGSISVFYHKESQFPQLKLRLASASKYFLKWMYKMLKEKYQIVGGSISKQKSKGVYCLLYGKRDAGKILRLMYYSKAIPFLKRKFMVAEKWASGEIG